MTIVMLRAGHQVRQHSAPAAGQMLANLVNDYPSLPWKIAVLGLHESDGGYEWARCVLIAFGLI